VLVNAKKDQDETKIWQNIKKKTFVGSFRETILNNELLLFKA
jgi:hypothetical protein